MNKTEICNLALQFIGARNTIASINEGSVEANALAAAYDNALDTVLEACFWNCARKQIAAVVIYDATLGQPVISPWVYEYQYPSDCIKVRDFIPAISVQQTLGVVNPSPSGIMRPVDFLSGVDFDSLGNPFRVLLTNEPQAQLIYTFRNTYPETYDPTFARCFAQFLGASVAMTLTGDKGLTQAAFQTAAAMLKEAEASNNNEGLTIINTTPDWIRARGYAADVYPDLGFGALTPNGTYPFV